MLRPQFTLPYVLICFTPNCVNSSISSSILEFKFGAIFEQLNLEVLYCLYATCKNSNKQLKIILKHNPHACILCLNKR